jgi:hypothetical protein
VAVVAGVARNLAMLAPAANKREDYSDKTKQIFCLATKESTEIK